MEKIDSTLRNKIYDCLYNAKNIPNNIHTDYSYQQNAFVLYKDIFGEYPSFNLRLETNKDELVLSADESGKLSVVNDVETEIPKRIESINVEASLKRFNSSFSDYCICVSKEMVIFKNAILYAINYEPSIISNDKEVVDEIIKELVYYNEKENNMYYVSIIKGDFTTFPLDIKEPSDDLIEKNYNSDIPNERIKEILSDDNPSLIIFHGEPGTGKTTYIKYLSKVMDKKFYILDNSLLDYITSATFIDFIMRRKNSVFVIEDCEALLVEREKTNSSIASLLNLTDGIIGSSLNSKFICTFNTDIKNIDKALLRKGRLKMKYEFKKLSLDKTNSLQEKLNLEKTNKPLTIAEIYNTENNGNIKEVKKIGF